MLAAGALAAETIHFDSAPPGPPPAGWTVAMTHAGGPPKWEILADPTAPSKPHVLAQTSADRTGARFPLAVYDKASFTNGEISVACKPVSGQGDQACGVVWRYQDENNYYIARSNAIENNVVLYKVEGGKRTAIAPKGTPPKTYGVKHAVPSGVWSTLKVVFQGPRFELWFNGQNLFEAEDPTFAGAGKAGLWTKADSVTHFDDFQVVTR